MDHHQQRLFVEMFTDSGPPVQLPTRENENPLRKRASRRRSTSVRSARRLAVGVIFTRWRALRVDPSKRARRGDLSDQKPPAAFTPNPASSPVDVTCQGRLFNHPQSMYFLTAYTSFAVVWAFSPPARIHDSSSRRSRFSTHDLYVE